MDRTKVAESVDAERMVSVRPSLNMRREALSYVAQQCLYSLNTQTKCQNGRLSTFHGKVSVGFIFILYKAIKFSVQLSENNKTFK